MPVLLRMADRKFVHVPEEDVNRLLMSGEVGFAPGQDVPIRTRDNRFFILPAERAVKAIGRQGARYDLEAGRRRRRKRMKEHISSAMTWEDEALAPLLGFTDMMTFGSVTEASSRIAYMQGGNAAEKLRREHLAMVRGEFPKSVMAGEVLGALVPIEGLGAGYKAATASREAIAASLIQKGVSETKARAIAKTAGGVVQQTIEGGIVGGQAALTDIGLGRVDNYVEHFAGNVGFGGVLGAGVGGGLGLTSLGMQGLKGGIKSMWNRATGEGMKDWAYRKWAKSVARATDSPEDALEFFRGPEGRRMAALATSTKREMRKTASQGLKIFNEGETANVALAGELLGGIKASTIRGLVPPMSAAPAEETIGRVLAELQSNLTTLNKTTSKTGRIKEAVQLKGVLDDITREFQQMANPTSKVTGPLGKAEMGGNMFLLADRLKRTLTSRVGKIRAPYGNDRAVGALERMRSTTTTLRTHLEDVAVYGDAAKLQQEINAATTRYLGLRKSDDVRALLKKMPRTGFERQKHTARQEAFERLVAKDAVEKSLHDPGNRLAVLRDLDLARADLAEVAAKYYDAPGLQKIAAQAKANSGRFGKWFADTVERGKAIDQYRKLAGAHSPIAGMPALARQATNIARWGGIGGSFVSGTPLAMTPWAGMYAGTRVLETIVQPARMIKVLGAIERKRVLNFQRIGKAVRGSFKPLRDNKPAALQNIGRMLTPAVVMKNRFVPRTVGRPRKEDADQPGLASTYKKRLRELATLLTDPQRIGEAVWKGANHHPDLPSQFLIASQVKVHQITKYLVDAAPKPQIGIMTESWEPDPGQLAVWTRRVQTVNDPVGVLERTLSGMVTQEELDTLTVCYPTLYEDMRQAIMTSIGPQDWPKIPYDLRVAVGSFLNMPTDPSLQPAFTGRMLQQYEEALTAPPPVAGLPKRDQMGRFSSKSKSFASDRAALVTEKFG